MFVMITVFRHPATTV